MSTSPSTTPNFYSYPGILGHVLTESYLSACRSIGLAERPTMRGLVNLVAYAQVIDEAEGQGATRLLLASLPDPVLWPHVAGQRAAVVLFGTLEARVECAPAPLAPLDELRSGNLGWQQEARDADQPPCALEGLDLHGDSVALERAAIADGAHPDLILIAPAWPTSPGRWMTLRVRDYAPGAKVDRTSVHYQKSEQWGARDCGTVQAHWCRAWWKSALDLFDAGHCVARIAAHWMSFDNQLWLARALARPPRATSRIFARHNAQSAAMVRSALHVAALYPQATSHSKVNP